MICQWCKKDIDESDEFVRVKWFRKRSIGLIPGAVAVIEDRAAFCSLSCTVKELDRIELDTDEVESETRKEAER